MEFHGEFSMEIHGIPQNSMEVFHTGQENPGNSNAEGKQKTVQVNGEFELSG